ncbi:hypothetical protein [Streptomyces sp. NPDC006285]|uniref:hypothetical protein n=1 Tax=Streptomyces sp. NPDC006285 TaxID=3364742 RepID=UPI00367EDBF6
MRVVVREAFSAYINHQPEDFHAGQKIKGDTAVLLLQRRAAVDPEDDEARELDALYTGSNDTPDDGDGDDGKKEPAPSGDLDIDAPVADVLAWVGENQERASQALELEKAKSAPRSTLVKALEKTAAASA